jgi:hypothetical protein
MIIYTLQSQRWRSVESHICQNRADMGTRQWLPVESGKNLGEMRLAFLKIWRAQQ